jgi:hypothetical protein
VSPEQELHDLDALILKINKDKGPLTRLFYWSRWDTEKPLATEEQTTNRPDLVELAKKGEL